MDASVNGEPGDRIQCCLPVPNCLAVIIRKQVQQNERVDAVMTSLIKLARWASGQTFRPLELGFSEESAFIRAFRRWQGETPARYRERLP